MEIVMWLITLCLGAVTAFGLGYWFGYKCGQQDAEEGIREP
jgi:hypothetical protein